MGGNREITVPGKVRGKSTDQHIDGLRIHENKGQVHFHGGGLKVAVPVNRWYTAWENLRFELGSRRFYDIKTSCVLTVLTYEEPGQTQPPGVLATAGIIKVQLSIQQIQMSPEFESLDKFTNG